MSLLKDRRGVTLVELMVALAIISVGILGFFGAFSFISKSLHVSRSRSLATNLAQEKIESLKNLSYYELLITTHSAVDNNFSPGLVYDDTNYSPETISIGGITFKRYTFVSLAQIDNDVISTVTYTFPDTGMKQVTTYVVWLDGTSWKKWTLTNLYENPLVNPLDSTITGNVQTSLGVNLMGAKVLVEQNPDWNATVDSSGNFSFRVYHGSYTVRASSSGYYDAVSGLINADQGYTVNPSPNPLQLTAIASGTVRGNAWLNPDIVIAGVSVSSKQADQNNFQLQYIELYNPTTAAINIGGAPDLVVNYKAPPGCSNADDCSTSGVGIKLVYNSTYVAPNHYFLIANTDTFTLNGTALTPDAVIDDSARAQCGNQPNNNLWDLTINPHKKMILDPGHGGAVWLSRGSTIVDAVGWQHNGNLPEHYEGTYLTITGNASNGFPIDEQIVRIASPTANFSLSDQYTYGRGYDSGNNTSDFAFDPAITSIVVTPRNTGNAAKAPVAGVPAAGSIVASTDPYSGSATAGTSYISSGSYSLAYSPFILPGVTTGTWEVSIASGNYFQQVTAVSVVQNSTTSIANAATSPSWPGSGVSSVFLTSSSLTGFVKGLVTDANGNLLSGINVTAGGTTKTTGTNGAFFIGIATGTMEVIANENNANSSYVESDAFVVTTPGQIADQNFILSKGGSVQGYLTSGTTPLPNYVVYATIGGSQYGSGTSNTSGVFTIRNLSTGTYTIAPNLDVGQDSSPNSTTASVTSASSVWVGTFTVSGALGSITGTVRYNGTLVTTGALIVASTGTISSTLPSIAASTSAALSPFYAISSKADGTYTLPVRGNGTYNLSAYIPSISGTGTSVTVTTKTYSGIAVTPSNATTKDITVP